MKTIEQLLEQRQKLLVKYEELKKKIDNLDQEIEDRKSREARDKINSLDLNESEYKDLISFLSKENKVNVLKVIESFKKSADIPQNPDKEDEE